MMKLAQSICPQKKKKKLSQNKPSQPRIIKFQFPREVDWWKSLLANCPAGVQATIARAI